MSFKQRLIAVVLLASVFSTYSLTLLAKQKFIGDMVLGNPSDSVLFVGDVMLARNVEDEIKAQNKQSIFRYVRAFEREHTFVVANFESAIPEVHERTKDFTFQFSTTASTLALLHDAGFSHLSLANNHALDYGTEGFENTVKSIKNASLTPFGHPQIESKDSVTHIVVNETTISLIGIHAVWRSPDMKALKKIIDEEAKSTDVQIAVIHWGEEYEPVHSKSQEWLAHELIDSGVDAIIGHHPHVIQDIGLYKNVPIFYSLGNYVFDQYWNDAVQTGLAITVIPEESTLTFKITPVVSERSVPKLMNEDDSEKYLQTLAKTSDSAILGDITRGVITVRR